MKMRKHLYRDQDQNQENGNGAPAATETVSKADFDKLHSQFEEFTGLVTQNFLKGDGMREGEKPPAPAAAAAQDMTEMNDEEIAQYGFEPKQVQFINKLVNGVASKVAKEISTNTISQVTMEGATNSKLQELDKQAYDEFPDLKNKSSDLYKLTDRIMQEGRQLDKSADKRPDFLLASALRAQRALEKSTREKNNFDNNQPRHQRFDAFSVEVGSHSSGVAGKNKDQNVSEERKQLRGLLGGR